MPKTKSFFQTAFGSFIKIMGTAMIGQLGVALAIQFSSNSDIFSWDAGVWKAVIGSAIGAGLLVWKNYKDPAFPIYGKKPKDDIIIDNPAT